MSDETELPLLDQQVVLGVLRKKAPLMRRVIAAFDEDTAESLARIEECLAGDDLPGAAYAAHNLAGQALWVGGRRCATLALQVERAAQRNDEQTCRSKARLLAAEVAELSTALHQTDWTALCESAP